MAVGPKSDKESDLASTCVQRNQVTIRRGGRAIAVAVVATTTTDTIRGMGNVRLP